LLVLLLLLSFSFLFFFNFPPPPQFYTLSLHDALPISSVLVFLLVLGPLVFVTYELAREAASAADTVKERQAEGTLKGTMAKTPGDRKSTRLNSSHVAISYAVFCLKKKKKEKNEEGTKQ